MTFTVILHVAPAAIVPPLSATDVPVGEGVTVPVQPLNAGEGGVAKNTPVGRSSVRVVPVKVVFALFTIVMVNWLTPPANMLVGLKLLLTEGIPVPVTFKVARASVAFVMLIPPGPVELNLPGGIILIQLPGTLEVTLTETVHDADVAPVLAGTVPLLKEMSDEPAFAVTVPPQVFEAMPTTFILVGILSAHEALLN